MALQILLEAVFPYNEQTSRVSPMQNEQVTNVVRFGGFELDTSSGELTGNDRKIPLQDQPFQILKLLTERPGEVVTREEIRRRLWPDDTVVEFENAVNAAIKKLRIALGDSAEEPRYVDRSRLTRRTADRAPCTRILRRYLLPRLLMPNSLALPPVECCRGTSPSQDANSRPLWKAEPLPIAATIAVATNGPIPGICLSR